MNPLNRQLQEAFLFTNSDLNANRSGRLSPRQQSRLRAARGSQRLAMVIFIVVMVGTLGVIALGSLLSGASANVNAAENFFQWAIIIAVVLGVILIGLLVSRPYLTNAAPKQMVMAHGPAQVGRIKPDAARYEIRIGAAVLRLLTEEQLTAFQPGTEYRVFFIPGPVPTVLSGEVVGTEAEAEIDKDGDESAAAQDVVVQMHSRARPILYVLALLALGIPIAGFAATYLPAALRWLVMAGLLVVAIGFVFWALRRVSKN